VNNADDPPFGTLFAANGDAATSNVAILGASKGGYSRPFGKRCYACRFTAGVTVAAMTRTGSPLLITTL
jgi:hypothetical protein